MSIHQIYEKNHEACLYIGNVDQKIDEEILWELMVQAGPLATVHLPKDKITQQHMGYGFIEYKSEEDADYAIKVLNMVKLFGKPLRLNKSSKDRRVAEVGANLFVGNLSEDVDEKTLYDTFASFGVLLFAKIMRDENGEGKGFGFISYDSFDAADNALTSMNGQFLCNRPISVSYAYKKDSRGERHGSAAERLLAEHRPEGIGKGHAGEKGNGKGSTDDSMRPPQVRPPSGVPPRPMIGVPPKRTSMPPPPNMPPPPGMHFGNSGPPRPNLPMDMPPPPNMNGGGRPRMNMGIPPTDTYQPVRPPSGRPPRPVMSACGPPRPPSSAQR